jgi:hypothetical protein
VFDLLVFSAFKFIKLLPGITLPPALFRGRGEF